MGDLSNLASSVSSHSVASPSFSSSFLKSSRSLSSTSIGCMLKVSESPSLVKPAVTRPYSNEGDVLAAGTFLAIALSPLMTYSTEEAIGRLLAVSAAKEGFCYILTLPLLFLTLLHLPTCPHIRLLIPGTALLLSLTFPILFPLTLLISFPALPLNLLPFALSCALTCYRRFDGNP
jgi:hypothetical protein